MRRIGNNAPKGLSRQTIRIWGLLFLVAGAVGQAVVMNKMLGMAGQSASSILSIDPSDKNITMVIVAILSQIAYACAIPLYTFLLVDGFRRTSRIRDYALRLAGVAVLAEIPYNLVFSGKWLDLGNQNPMVAMVLGVGMLYFFNYYSGKKIKNILIRVLVVVLGLVWVKMLKINHGEAVVIMICTLWALRKRRGLQIIGGCSMMFMIGAMPGLGTPMYWLSPVIFLAINFYNEEQGDENRWFNYLSYPVILLIVGLIANYAM